MLKQNSKMNQKMQIKKNKKKWKLFKDYTEINYKKLKNKDKQISLDKIKN